MRMRKKYIKKLGINIKDWGWGLVNSGSSLAVGEEGLLEEPMAWQEEFAQEELTTTTTETSAALPTRLWHMSGLSLLSLLSSLSLSLSSMVSCNAYISWILFQAVIRSSKTDSKQAVITYHFFVSDNRHIPNFCSFLLVDFLSFNCIPSLLFSILLNLSTIQVWTDWLTAESMKTL